MSASDDFKKKLGADLATALGPEWKFFRSRLELQRRFAAGHHSVVVSGSSKWSPLISISFHFGVCFAEARKVEKALGRPQPSYYQIHYYAVNGPRSMGGLAYDGAGTWDVSIDAPSEGLVERLRLGVLGMAFPFFERFGDPRAARDALVARDPWCFGGRHAWGDVLTLDAVLGDLAHFEAWVRTLPQFEKDQALRELARLR